MDKVDDVIKGWWRHHMNSSYSTVHTPIDYLSYLGSDIAVSLMVLEKTSLPVGTLSVITLYMCLYVCKKSQKQSLTLSNPLGSCSKFSNFRASRPLPSNSPSNFTLKCCSNFSSSSIFTFSIFWPIRGQLGPIKGLKYRFRALRLLPSDLPSNFT